jgi:hypothetical protein
VLLYHDTAKRPIDAGPVLVSTPFLPNKFFFWVSLPRRFRASASAATAAIYDANERNYRRMTGLRGERSPELNLDMVTVPPPTNPPYPCNAKGLRKRGATAEPLVSGG